ncbi:MAG: hypothetical protein WC861_04140 [Candidatus Micrarchaeia archaeon]|jgi:hypothetical protein
MINTKFAVFAFAAALLLCGAAFADPILQITNYTTLPTDVYPGTIGYLQIKLANTGDATAQSVTSHYVINGLDRTDSLGEISAGSNAQVAVPFKISPSSVGSIQLVNIDIFYSMQSTTTGSSSSKRTSLSVPLLVKQFKPLEAKVVEMKGLSIAPGEKLPLMLTVKNTGGVVNNLVISMPDNSSFSIDGGAEKSVGTLLLNESVNVSLTLASSSDTKTGTYPVGVEFTYQDALNQPTSDIIYIGPVSVLESSTQYRLTFVPLDAPVEIGSQEPFLLTLENAGGSPISGAIDINSTAVFTPIGAQRLYFENVPVGGSASMNIIIGIGATQSAGYYTLPVRLTPNAGQAVSYNMGIAVAATPEVTVTLDSSGAVPSVQVANTGNSQIRSVYASATPAGSQTATESFMGTLNVDDFATLTLGSSATGRSVDVEIRFRDTSNQEHTISKTLSAVAGNSSFVQGTRGQAGGAAAAGNAGNFANRNNNPLGFLFGGASGRAASSGPDMVTIVVVAAVLLVAAYLIYRRFFAKKGAPKQSPLEILESLRPSSEAGKKKEAHK